MKERKRRTWYYGTKVRERTFKSKAKANAWRQRFDNKDNRVTRMTYDGFNRQWIIRVYIKELY